MHPIRIILPTDFSTLAQEALVFGLHLCADLKAEPVFVHISAAQAPDPETLLREKISLAYQSSGISPTSESKIDIRTHEKPFQGIMEAIDVHEAGAVVMGTHGFGGLRSMLVGSQTASLIGASSCPVIAIPQGVTYRTVFKIGFSTDLNDLYDRVNRVMHLIRPLGATIDLFHVYPVFPEMNPIESVDVEAMLQTLRDQFQYEKFNFHFVHTRSDNDGHAGIAEYLRCYKPEWLSMVTSPKTVFDSLVTGSLTKETLGQVQLPLLAYSDPD